jgi:hypothetical protein
VMVFIENIREIEIIGDRITSKSCECHNFLSSASSFSYSLGVIIYSTPINRAGLLGTS